MSRELIIPKHGATSHHIALDVARALIRAGFSAVNEPDVTPKSTAKKGVKLIRQHFGENAAFSQTGESVKLVGTHMRTGKPTEIAIRVAMRDGKQVGRLRDDEITAITLATGFLFPA